MAEITPAHRLLRSGVDRGTSVPRQPALPQSASLDYLHGSRPRIRRGLARTPDQDRQKRPRHHTRGVTPEARVVPLECRSRARAEPNPRRLQSARGSCKRARGTIRRGCDAMCWRCERADASGLQTSYSRWNRGRGGAARESPVVDRGLGSDSGMGAWKDSAVCSPAHFLTAIPETLAKTSRVVQIREQTLYLPEGKWELKGK